MAIIRMTAQEAREYVKANNAKLQIMYDVAPFADKDPNPEAKTVARGFAAFKKYICKKEKNVDEVVLQA
jgi:hypothetical protein